MKTSEKTGEIAGALAKAQGMMRNPDKNKSVIITHKAGGGRHSFTYADLPNTIDTAREALCANGLSHSAATDVFSDHILLTVRLGHSSDQWYESRIPLAANPDPKMLAGNLTYFKRYLLQGLIGVAGDEDLDGEPEAGAEYQDRRPKPQPSVKASPVKPRAEGEVSQAVVPPKTQPDSPTFEVRSDPEMKALENVASKAMWKNWQVMNYVKERFKKATPRRLTTQEYSDLVTTVQMMTFPQAMKGLGIIEDGDVKHWQERDEEDVDLPSPSSPDAMFKAMP